MQDDLQEQFGASITSLSGVYNGAQGLASPPATFTTPAGVTGPPPFTGITQLTPTTAARPKGIQINTITAVYSVGAVDATVNTLGLYKTTYSNAAAPAVSTILAASNLTKTHSTDATKPYVTTLTLSTPAMITTQNCELNLEWKVTTGAATGTSSIWGVILQCSYNYQ